MLNTCIRLPLLNNDETICLVCRNNQLNRTENGAHVNISRGEPEQLNLVIEDASYEVVDSEHLSISLQSGLQ